MSSGTAMLDAPKFHAMEARLMVRRNSRGSIGNGNGTNSRKNSQTNEEEFQQAAAAAATSTTSSSSSSSSSSTNNGGMPAIEIEDESSLPSPRPVILASDIWHEYRDNATGKTYFHNLRTNATVWEKPLPAAGSVVSKVTGARKISTTHLHIYATPKKSVTQRPSPSVSVAQSNSTTTSNTPSRSRSNSNQPFQPPPPTRGTISTVTGFVPPPPDSEVNTEDDSSLHEPKFIEEDASISSAFGVTVTPSAAVSGRATAVATDEDEDEFLDESEINSRISSPRHAVVVGPSPSQRRANASLTLSVPPGAGQPGQVQPLSAPPVDEWRAVDDAASGQVYWYNRRTRATSWADPMLIPIGADEETNNSTPWRSHHDPQGRIYYHNTTTNETRWERPSEMGPVTPAPVSSPMTPALTSPKGATSPSPLSLGPPPTRAVPTRLSITPSSPAAVSSPQFGSSDPQSARMLHGGVTGRFSLISTQGHRLSVGKLERGVSQPSLNGRDRSGSIGATGAARGASTTNSDENGPEYSTSSTSTARGRLDTVSDSDFDGIDGDEVTSDEEETIAPTLLAMAGKSQSSGNVLHASARQNNHVHAASVSANPRHMHPRTVSDATGAGRPGGHYDTLPLPGGRATGQRSLSIMFPSSPASPGSSSLFGSPGSAKQQRLKCTLAECTSFAVRDSYCLRHIWRQDGSRHDMLEGTHNKKLLGTFLAAKEILTSEKSYLDGLRIIQRAFYQRTKLSLSVFPEQGKAPLCNEDDLSRIFMNISEILALSEQLYSDLYDLTFHDRLYEYVATTLLHYIPRFSIYSLYLEGFEESRGRLQKLKEINPEFNNFVRITEKCEGGSLDAFLVTPVQRLPRYLLLIKELLRRIPAPANGEHHDAATLQIISDLNTAYDTLAKMTTSLNTALNTSENLLQLKTLSRLFLRTDARFQSFVKENRKLVKQGILRKKFSNKSYNLQSYKLYYFFLCNDLIFYAESVGSVNKGSSSSSSNSEIMNLDSSSSFQAGQSHVQMQSILNNAMAASSLENVQPVYKMKYMYRLEDMFINKTDPKITLKATKKAANPLKFYMWNNEGRVIVLQAGTESEREQWYDAIDHAIESTKKQVKALKINDKQKKYATMKL